MCYFHAESWWSSSSVYNSDMLCVPKAEVEACPQEDRLLKRFFRDNEYFPTSRPVANVSDSVPVKFGVVNFETFELVCNLSFTVLPLSSKHTTARNALAESHSVPSFTCVQGGQ